MPVRRVGEASHPGPPDVVGGLPNVGQRDDDQTGDPWLEPTEPDGFPGIGQRDDDEFGDLEEVDCDDALGARQRAGRRLGRQAGSQAPGWAPGQQAGVAARATEF